MPFTLAGNTFSFMWDRPVVEALDALGALGLSTFDVIVTPGHLWHSELEGAGRATLRRTLEERNYTLDSLNPPATDYNLASLTPDVRQLAIGMYRETINLAADLGAKGVVVVPGRVSSLLPPPREQLWGVLEDGIGALAEHARSKGLVLHLEVHPLTPVPTALETVSLVERIASPAVGIAYDVANAEFIGEDQVNAIAAMGRYLTQIHLSDATRTRWMHGGFGTGTVDLEAVLNALDESGFSGAAVLEIISDSPIRDFQESIARVAAARKNQIQE